MNIEQKMSNYNYVHSHFGSEYSVAMENEYTEEVQKIKDDVKSVMNELVDPLAKFEFIDAIQRLGLEYHFEKEIKHVLKSIHENASANPCQDRYDDLNAVAIRFRLLRQHGFYEMPQDVFRQFMDASGNFLSTFKDDLKGLQSLYEASFYGFIGETVMDKARLFSAAHLRSHKETTMKTVCSVLARKIEHALEMPVHWRPNRVEATWFMDAYEEEPDMNPRLLRLAKLDYNAVQSIQRRELSQLTRWWSELGLGTMTFSRDSLIEHYLSSIAILFEPRYKDFREIMTKIACMITLIDDVYDKLGSSLEELQLLTHLIDRWDNTRAGELPPTMRTCFLALYTITNQIGDWILINRGIDVNQHLQNVWADQCKAYLVEAKWCYEGLKPTAKDYLSNAVKSVGGFIVLLCCFFITMESDGLTEDKVDYISRIPSIMQSSTLIARLNNDLVPTPSKLAEGDRLNLVQCFMSEWGASEGEARQHVENLVHETWKALNRDLFDDKNRRLASRPFMRACQNLGRASHWIYQYGDGHEAQSQEARERLMSILVRPVPIDRTN